MAAPRILRWGYKTGFESGTSEKIVSPLFQTWGTSKQISVMGVEIQSFVQY